MLMLNHKHINDEDRAGNCTFDIGDFLRNKKAIIVPQNKKNDPFCLLWATTIWKFTPEGHKGRITKELREESKFFNIEGISFPAGRDDAIKFFKQNNIKAHCFCAMINSERIDHFITARDPEIILIFRKNPEGEAHWGLIPSISSLSLLISSGISKSKRACLICTNCHLNSFRTPKALEEHQELCFKNEPQILSVPPKGTTIQFKNFKNIVKCPIKIVADFECY